MSEPDIFEFKSFGKIERLHNLRCEITEKIHGSNAQIVICRDQIRAGSRNRFLTQEDDNYGFAKFVEENKQDLISFFGDGRHYGEWYGNGINAGYGLKEKRFASFETYLRDKPGRPERVDIVPVIYEGMYSAAVVDSIMKNLEDNGSILVPGFKPSEGLVIHFRDLRKRFKKVLIREDKPNPKNASITKADKERVDAYLQPVRLEKLLSREERYVRDYPNSLPQLAKDYINDLIEECPEFLEEDKPVIKQVKRKVFPFIKETIEGSYL